MFYLSKEAFKRNAIDELWRVKAATSAKSHSDQRPDVNEARQFRSLPG
jgi:hypothetical protein